MSAKTGVFVDISNIYYCVGKRYLGRKVDYAKYLDQAVAGETLYRAFAYGAQLGSEANKFLGRLRSSGYTPRYKKPKEFDNPDYRINLEVFEKLLVTIGEEHPTLTAFKAEHMTQLNESMDAVRKALKTKKDIRKADWDVGLAIDAVRIAQRLDRVVIGSADGDLAPLVEWVREQGCYCTVFACNISRELRDMADEYIEIDESILER